MGGAVPQPERWKPALSRSIQRGCSGSSVFGREKFAPQRHFVRAENGYRRKFRRGGSHEVGLSPADRLSYRGDDRGPLPAGGGGPRGGDLRLYGETGRSPRETSSFRLPPGEY